MLYYNLLIMLCYIILYTSIVLRRMACWLAPHETTLDMNPCVSQLDDYDDDNNESNDNTNDDNNYDNNNNPLLQTTTIPTSWGGLTIIPTTYISTFQLKHYKQHRIGFK